MPERKWIIWDTGHRCPATADRFRSQSNAERICSVLNARAFAEGARADRYYIDTEAHIESRT